MPDRRRWIRWSVAGLAVAGLLLSIPHLAAPAPGSAPGWDGNAPSWLRGLYGSGIRIGDEAYYGLLWVAFAAYLGLAATAAYLPSRLLWVLIGAVAVAFTLSPPLLSHDVFSYISYARLGVAHGLDPYAATPSMAPSDPVFAYVAWPHTASVYGPLFTLLTYPLALVSVPVALWTLKAIAGLSVLAIAWLVARLARLRGLEPRTAAALVGLNPLVYVQVIGGAHNDALMTLLSMAGVGALLLQRGGAGGAAAVAAVSAKVPAAVFAPFAALGSPSRRGLLLGAGVTTLAIGAATATVFHSHALAAIGLAAQDQASASRHSIPSTLSRLTGLPEGPIRTAALAAYAGSLAGLLAWTARGGDWVRAAGWAVLGALLATAWLLPWYLIWVLPLAAISRDRRLVVSVLALTALQLANRVPV